MDQLGTRVIRARTRTERIFHALPSRIPFYSCLKTYLFRKPQKIFSLIFFVLLFTGIIIVTSSSFSIEPTLPVNTSTQLSILLPNLGCQPYIVRDSRPFHEREPPQTNLPQRVSNVSHEDLLRKLRSLKLVAVACARNVEKHIDKFRQHIEPIVDLFHPLSRIIIIESDSEDKTVEKLRQWSRAEVHTRGSVQFNIPSRTERIAYCRNELLNKTRQLKPDYMLMTDFDIFAANISSFLTNFNYDINNWSVMTANTRGGYYDIWALRTLSDSILNFDVWHRVWDLQRHPSSYCNPSLIDNIIGIHQKMFPVQRDILEVRSAFGGTGLYKMDAIEGCQYSGAQMTCEHVPFHTCLREKNRARIFINPAFLIG